MALLWCLPFAPGSAPAPVRRHLQAASSQAQRPTPVVPRLRPLAALQRPSWSSSGAFGGERLFGSAASAVALAFVGGAEWRRRRRRTPHATARRIYVTGPGWTDEIARIFDPRPDGPDFHPAKGYRGRRPLRILLDGQDLCHSYAQACHDQFGQWTGPLSTGIQKAFEYGAWNGVLPSQEFPQVGPLDPRMDPPAIEAIVAMPADMIEHPDPVYVVDGYPEDFREALGRCLVEPEDGWYVNEWIRELQDEDRLITWRRPARLPGYKQRPSAAFLQKYYKMGEPVPIVRFERAPVILSQVLGTGTTLKVGDKVEALKAGRLVTNRWQPSAWREATVLAVNYDGTYDLKFTMNFGPFRVRKFRGITGKVKTMMSLSKNERWRQNHGSDEMPASFRLLEDLYYQQSVPPDRIRVPGTIERLTDMVDAQGLQDWYLVTSKQFMLEDRTNKRFNRSKPHIQRDHDMRLQDFNSRFQINYRWVPTPNGPRFEPVPTEEMATALTTSHQGTAEQFELASESEKRDLEELQQLKDRMTNLRDLVEQVEPIGPDAPTRPAGPKKDEMTARLQVDP